MLLPSAFPCDVRIPNQSSRPERPKLHSFGAYDVSSSRTPSTPGSANILSSCRTLQSILGNTAQPVQPVQRLLPELHTTKSTVPLNPFIKNQGPRLPPRVAAIPRGTSKRGRDEYEEDLTASINGLQLMAEEKNVYQTPKRQRHAPPPDLPKGLHASDFDVLNTPLQPTLRSNLDGSTVKTIRPPSRVDTTQSASPKSKTKMPLSIVTTATNTQSRAQRRRLQQKKDQAKNKQEVEWSPEDKKDENHQRIVIVRDKSKLPSKCERGSCDAAKTALSATNGVTVTTKQPQQQQGKKDKSSLGRRLRILVGRQGNFKVNVAVGAVR